MHGWTLEYVEEMDDVRLAKVKNLLLGYDEALAVLRDPKHTPNLPRGRRRR